MSEGVRLQMLCHVGWGFLLQWNKSRMSPIGIQAQTHLAAQAFAQASPLF